MVMSLGPISSRGCNTGRLEDVKSSSRQVNGRRQVVKTSSRQVKLVESMELMESVVVKKLSHADGQGVGDYY